MPEKENQQQAEQNKTPDSPKKTGAGLSLFDVATAVLTALAITMGIGLVGFGGLYAYSSMSYRAQLAENQQTSTAANSPTLSGYAYSGPNGTHRPDDWPEPTAQFAGPIEHKDESTDPQATQPTEQSEKAPAKPQTVAQDPEPETEPVQEPAAPSTSSPSNGGPSSSSGASSGNSGQSSGGSIAPSDTSSGNSNSLSTSKTGSSGTWGEDSTTNEITGSLDQTAYWTKGGKSYHFSSTCPSLSQSKNVLSGTLQDALDAGKKDPCNNCANGS